jgi:3-methyladenine DNA glycosylase AlkD
MHTLIRQRLHQIADPEKTKVLQSFFKTGPGEYAEGDLFIGVSLPDQRALARDFAKTITLNDIRELLLDEVHECRLTALILLDHFYKRNKRDTKAQKQAVDLYLELLDQVNNWDLVDTSAHKILGVWLEDKERDILYTLARSGHLWRQRVAIIATMHFIDRGDFIDTFQIAEILLRHPHDLIHKAVGWMLRCVGNVDRNAEEAFLRIHYRNMPRTMLRYAIEKFPEDLRQDYLKGRVD